MPNDVGTMYATWTEPDGAEWALSNTADDYGLFTTNGPAGWGAPPYEIVTDPLSRGGVRVRFVRAEPARLTWPLHVWGETHQQFIDRWRALRGAFLSTLHRGVPGTLRVARPDGSAREIQAYYEDGFTGLAGQNWLSASPVLTLLCPDPYWRDITDTVLPFSYGLATNYLAPYPQVSSSQVLGATTVNNPGEVVAWPQWTVTGPMAALAALNNTTGQQFELTYALAAGQTITITTEEPTVRGPSGENLVSALNWPTAYLWPLLAGDNDVEFNVSGAGVGTAVSLSFRARYEGA